MKTAFWTVNWSETITGKHEHGIGSIGDSEALVLGIANYVLTSFIGHEWFK